MSTDRIVYAATWAPPETRPIFETSGVPWRCPLKGCAPRILMIGEVAWISPCQVGGCEAGSIFRLGPPNPAALKLRPRIVAGDYHSALERARWLGFWDPARLGPKADVKLGRALGATRWKWFGGLDPDADPCGTSVIGFDDAGPIAMISAIEIKAMNFHERHRRGLLELGW